MGMRTIYKSPRSGAGRAGTALTLALLVFCLVAFSTIIGCSGHNDPVSPDQSGVLYRSGQAFSEPEEWGAAGTLDSSTSTWAVGGGTVGDIATVDDGIDPLVTAFVKSKAIMGGVVISLMLKDSSWESVYEGDFYYQSGYQNCQHPAVEVTYSHPQASDGQLTVHIIWAQEFPNQWDIVYRQLQFDPTDEPPWEPTFYESARVTDTGSCYETQPDLAVYYPDGDLYAVCRAEVPGVSRYAIYAYKLPYEDGWDPGEWQSEGTVAQLDTTEKNYPSIDAGLTSRVVDAVLTQQVEVVWSQPVDGYKHIFYNAWDVGDSPDSGDAIRISPEIENAHQILPKIDALPYSSELNEAVIAWACENAGGGELPYAHVMMVATPFIGDEFDYPVYGLGYYSRCPDLAGCQGEYDEFEGQGLFALSHHYRDPSMVRWDIRASTYSVDVDYLNQTFEFNLEQWTLANSVPLWNPYWPFTGPTISLRIPDPLDWDENNFGMGWICAGYTGYLAQGDTI
jgi:hypothetical protein